MAETKTINLEVDTNLGSLKSQLRQAQAQVAALSDQFGVTSKQAAEAAKRAAELKDRIADAKDLTDAFNPDAKFNALSRSIGGALNGFQAFEGAMGLLGVESESLQKSLLKVQSAMALSQGLQGVLEAKDSFVQLGAVAKNALSGIRAGIAATGIGLFVVALGTIVAYWDDIKEAVSGVGEEQEKLNAKTDANVIAQQAKYDSIAGQENILKLQGKTEIEILKIKQAQVEAVIKATEVQLLQQEATKKSQIEATKRNYDILKAITKIGIESSVLAFRALAAPIDAVLETANAVADALGFDKITTTNLNKEISKLTETASEAVTKFIFDPKEVETEADKTIQATKDKLNALKNEAAGYQLAIKDINEKANTTAEDEAKKANDVIAKANAEANRLELERKQELDNKLEEIANQNFLSTLSDQEKELLATQDKYFELETLAQGNADALKEIELAKLNEINDINLKYQDIAYKQQEDAKAKQKELDDQAAKDKKETEEALAESLAAIREADFNNIFAGINLVKNLFENNKKVQAAALIAENAVGIAKTIIATKAANQAARAQGTAAAIATGGASVLAAEGLVLRNNIGAGISIAAQIAATAKGVAALGGGASPSGGGNLSEGGGSGGSGGMSPNFNVVGNSGMNQLAQIQQTPMQAYVVSGEVTSAQALDRNRIKNATL